MLSPFSGLPFCPQPRVSEGKGDKLVISECMSGSLFTHLLMYVGATLEELQSCIALGLSYCVQLLDFSVLFDLEMYGLHRKHQWTIAQGSV